MKLKQIIILFLIAVVLGAVLFIKKNRKVEEIQDQEYASLDFLSSLGEISRLTIYKGSNEQTRPLILKKLGDDKWAVESFYGVKVRKERIDPILEIFKTSKGELRSSANSNLADFRIDDERGLHVNALDSGNQQIHFIVGLKKAGYRGGFIREAGSFKTYLIDDDILSKFGIWDEGEEAKLELKFFLDQTLLDFNEETASYLSINRIADGRMAASIYSSTDEESGSRKWAFKRDDLPFDIDASKVKKFLKDILKKSGSEIKVIDENVDYGFSNPIWELVVGIENAEQRLIKGKFINEEVKDQIYMQIAQAPVVYIINDNIFKSMDKDDSYFFIDNPLRVNDEKLESITIYEKKDIKRFVREENEEGKWFWEGQKEPLSGDKMKSILEAVKKFKVEQLLFGEKETGKKSDSGFSIKTKDKEEIFIDIFPLIEKDGIKIYPAVKRKTPVYFAISENVYQDIFKKTQF